MKKLIAILAAVLLSVSCLYAQTTQKKSNGAVITTTEQEYDFGEIKEADGPVSHTFIIKNEGKAPLVLTRVTASCGCTKPEYNPEPIAPGEKRELKITYNPAGRPGQFVKTIAIYSNGLDGAYTVRIKGVVK